MILWALFDGVILAFGLSGNNFSLFVMIGLILLLGMVGAMLPLALGQGAGHELNSPMAWAIIGGLLSSTILALLVVPAIYRLMYPLDRWLRKWYEKDRI